MPAYNFMKIWKPKIMDGSKAQTIRGRRKHPTKPGQTLFLYTGLRTKYCELIGRAPCIEVVPVVIYPFAYNMKLNGSLLSQSRAMSLARKDGFDDLITFYKFFQRYEREVLDDFEIIKWNPKKLEVSDGE